MWMSPNVPKYIVNIIQNTKQIYMAHVIINIIVAIEVATFSIIHLA